MAINITLIFSRHKEDGICSVNSLLQIMENVNPDVIFEELSEVLYKESYIENKLNNLESVAIKKHLKNHQVKHIPVDTYDRHENYERDQYHLRSSLLKGAREYSALFTGLLDQQESLIQQFGFDFLNSDENDKAFEKIDIVKERILERLDNEDLYQLSLMDKAVIEKREDVMLDNVYQYSKENEYSRGLMFIGSGHRKSILKKIKERNKTENIKINWKYLSSLLTKKLDI